MMLCSHAVDALQTFTEACEKGLMATKERGWKEEDAGEARSYGRRSYGEGGVEKSSSSYKLMRMHTCVYCSQFSMVQYP